MFPRRSCHGDLLRSASALLDGLDNFEDLCRLLRGDRQILLLPRHQGLSKKLVKLQICRRLDVGESEILDGAVLLDHLDGTVVGGAVDAEARVGDLHAAYELRLLGVQARLVVAALGATNPEARLLALGAQHPDAHVHQQALVGVAERGVNAVRLVLQATGPRHEPALALVDELAVGCGRLAEEHVDLVEHVCAQVVDGAVAIGHGQRALP